MEIGASVIVSAIGIVITLLGAGGGIIWRLSRIEIALRVEIAGARAEATAQINAVQAKIYQVEIWARDEFVRKTSFEAVVSRLERSMEQLATKVETSVERFTTKVDQIVAELHHKD